MQKRHNRQFSIGCKFLGSFNQFGVKACHLCRMLRLWPLLLVSFVFCACEKTPDAGPQYTYSSEFIASTNFRDSTRWAILDDLGTPFDTLTVVEKDSQLVLPGPGTPGFTLQTYRLQFRRRIYTRDSQLNVDTLGTLPDSLRVPLDSVRGLSWRVLPFDSAFAGSFFGGNEEVLYFHTERIVVGETRQGLAYTEELNFEVGPGGPSLPARRFTRQTADSNQTREIVWGKQVGPISYVDGLGRRFYLRRL